MIDTSDARRHLRIDTGDYDLEIRQKLEEAIGLASAYIGKDPAVLPYDLQNTNYDYRTGASPEQAAAAAAEKAKYQDRGFDAAVLLILGELWNARESGNADPLSPAVKNLLNLYRNPCYA